jgi:hypothetical protein
MPRPFHPPWLITVIIFGKVYKLWSSSLCSLFQLLLTLSLLGPNILLNTLYSYTHNLCSSLSVREQVSHPCKRKVELSLCLTKHYTMKTYWGSGGMAPRIFKLGARWRWVASFKHRPLCSQGKSPRYALDRRLGGPESRCGHGDEDKISQPLSDLELRSSRPCPSCFTEWAITALTPIQKNK